MLTPAGMLAAFGYTDLGERASTTLGNGGSTTYAYDALGRMQTLTLAPPTAGSNLSIGFVRNLAGQITSRTADNGLYAYQAFTAGMTNYTINGKNQTTQAGSTAITYDARQDTHAIRSITLTYDPLDRLYEKDGLDDIRYVYDGSDLIAEYDGNGTLLRRYVHGPGSDEPLVWYEGSAYTDRRWLSADERGSVVGVTYGTSSTTINTYDEYGVPAAGNVGRFQYTGQIPLTRNNLYCYKARAYAVSELRQGCPVLINLRWGS